MATETVHRNDKPVGTLEQSGTKIIACDLKGTMLGYYDSHTNQTRRTNGALYGEGNKVRTLLTS